MRRTAVHLAVLLAGVAGSGVAARAAESASGHGPHHAAVPGPAAGRSHGEAYLETDLFFGTARPDGGPPVTDREFRRFVDAELTPRFPAGLTVQSGDGQYRDSHGVVERERSYQVILLYPAASARTADRLIEQVRRDYDRTFQQESVARVDENARVRF